MSSSRNRGEAGGVITSQHEKMFAGELYDPADADLDAAARREAEYGKPVNIGRDVWIGGGAIILPGVTIGARSVIGAGSDVPPDVFAAGNPCRIIREISEAAPNANRR